jgi:nucleoid DNA-binding protein
LDDDTKRLLGDSEEIKPMTKSELVEAVAEKRNITKNQAESVVSCLFDTMLAALKQGEVSSFEVSERLRFVNTTHITVAIRKAGKWRPVF